MSVSRHLLERPAVDRRQSRRQEKPLWTCPRCGNRFVTANLWHSCYSASVDEFFAGKSATARMLFDRYAEVIRSFGPAELVVSKTRIGFMVRVRFSNVIGFAKESITVAFWLKRRIDHPRLRRVDDLLGRDFIHYVRVRSPDDFDEQLTDWLREAYGVGQQRATDTNRTQTAVD